MNTKRLRLLLLVSLLRLGFGCAESQAQAPFTNSIKLGGGALGSIITNTSGAGAYTVTGGGNDIGGTNDEFTFHYFASYDTPSYLDLRARVASLEPDASWTKAGLMARGQSLGTTNRMAYCFVTPTGPTLDGKTGVGMFGFSYRTVAGSNSVDLDLATSFNPGYPTIVYPNAWLRLVVWSPQGPNTLQGYSSMDGTNWFLLGGWDGSVPFWGGGSAAAFGLAVSRNPNGPVPTANAEFRNYTSSGPFAPTLTLIPNTNIAENGSVTLGFTIGSASTPITNLVLAATASDAALVPWSTSTNALVLGGSGSSRSLTIHPATNQFGSTWINLQVSDRTNTASESFLLNVYFVNQPPSISGLPVAVALNEDSSINLPFTVGDLETPAADLVVSAASGNPALFPASSIAFGGADSSRNVTLAPVPAQYSWVSVFNDPKYVGMTLATNTQASLANLGLLATTFTNLNAAVSNNSRLLFPSQMNAALAPDLNGATRAALSNFVASPLPGAGYAITAASGAAVVPGTNDIGNHSDDGVVTIALPFPFTLYDQAFTNVGAGANGDLQFIGANTAYVNTCLPTGDFNYAIMPLWADLRADTGGGIYTSVSGSPPNRIFNIEWRAVYYTGGASNNFEVRLYESQPRFDIIYGTLGALGQGSPTVGVQKDTGSAFTQFTCSNYGALSNGLQLTFQPSGPGGLVIVHGAPSWSPGRAAGLLNTVFGFGVTESFAASSSFPLMPGAAAGTAFAGGPARLPYYTTCGALATNSLPPGARSLYETNGQSVVAEMPLGNGKIIYLGWDWDPAGGQDGGWLKVLQNAFLEGPQVPVPVPVIISVTDSNNTTTSATIAVSVLPVNHPPTIDPINLLPIVKGAPPQAIPLTGITAGPANEPQVGLTVMASTTNAALLSPLSVTYAPPQSTGTLNFSLVSSAVTTPVTNAYILVTVNDGGASNNLTTVSTRVEIHSTNWLPTLALSLTNELLLEDGQTNVLLIFSDSETPLANLALSADNNNPACVPATNISFGPLQTSGNTGQVLATISPLKYSFGTNLITFTVTDGNGGQASAALTLVVVPVNHPPTLDPPHNLTIVQDSGPQRNYLSGISAGPTNEPQNLNISVVSSNPAVVPNPVLYYTNGNATGYLVVTPAPGAIGNATIAITLDDGGASNNLVTRQFSVTVLSTNDIAKVGQGSADYINRLFFPSNNPALAPSNRLQAVSLAFFSGHVSKPPTTPASTNGSIRLLSSAFGQAAGVSLMGVPYLQLGASIDLSANGDPNTNCLPSGAFFIPATSNTPSLLYASQPGLLAITFLNGVTQWYYVLDQPAMGVEPATMYLTDIAGTNTGAPAVTISNLAVIVHHNSTITTNVLLTNTVPGGVQLRAADVPGRVVLEYRDKVSGAFSNIQVLVVKDYRTDYFTATNTIPGWLSPIHLPHTNNLPLVTRGLDSDGPAGTYYAFQYDNGPTDTNSGRVFATQPTPDTGKIELFWFKTSYGGITWPDEMDRYAAQWADNWQSDTNTMRIYLTKTDDGASTAAPGVTLSTLGVPNLTIHYNGSVPAQFLYGGTTNATFYLETGSRQLQARHYTGPILLHYNNSPPGGFIGFQLVEVRPYSPDVVASWAIGQQLAPANPINDVALGAPKPYVARGAPPDSPAYVYQHSPAAANPGTQDGFIFATRKATNSTLVEVFWKRRGLQNVEWPCEMDRYTFDWPTIATQYVCYARGTLSAPGATVSIPAANNAELMSYQDPPNHANLSGGQFWTTAMPAPGWALLKYTASNNVAFQVVRSLSHTVATDNGNVGVYRGLCATNIGSELRDPSGLGAGPGYVYLPDASPHNWDRYDWEIYDGNTNDPPEYQTRQVFAVNQGNLEVWWYQTNLGVGWPAYAWTYTNTWPANAGHLVIASQQGSGPIDPALYPDFRLYYQNDPTLPGFNPNDEQALILPSNDGSGDAVFALRSDLSPDPYVLLKYRNGLAWQYRIFKVLAQEGTNTFDYPLQAGLLIQPPWPLPVISLPPPPQNTNLDGRAWRDRKGFYWAKAGGDDGVSTNNVLMAYYYPVQAGFYFPSNYFSHFPPGMPQTNLPPAGSCFPWLDLAYNTPGLPVPVTNAVFWPADVPTLLVGETLVKSKKGLPEIGSMISAEVIYQQSVNQDRGKSVLLIDPTRVVTNRLACRLQDLNSPPTTAPYNGVLYFPTLPPHLRSRLWYDPTTTNLCLRGQWVDGIGVNEPKGYLLLNVLSERDRTNYIEPLSTDARFVNAVEGLATNVLEVQPNQPFDSLGLTAGRALGVGYVTIAENNSTNLNQPADPIALHILQVACPLYVGDIKTVESDNPFDDKLTLRLTGDFAGKADEYEFEWRYLPDTNGVPPPVDPASWLPFGSPPLPGALDITIAGPGVVTLGDNWFVTRYHRIGGTDPCGGAWSAWAPPQLAQGWIKRVLAKINPYEQRIQDYQNSSVNTIVSMISQAGARSLGAIPLNADAVNNYGLIEIYEMVLQRGLDLSVNAGYNDQTADQALLLAAGRLADLYLLLGNEAYADAADPTIAFGTDDKQYGSEATSIHCFMNQTASLLEEELALLRGRDNSLVPSVQTYPFYNRLIWNFTKDINGGEVAYALNYNIRNPDGSVSGTIDETTARKLYPQGHGDAWGHYLTAMLNYYRLLTHPNYTWTPAAEAVTVYDQPVTVDYLHERKFAQAAAAKARTGAEIVNLTYRRSYQEQQDGLWLDAPDSNTNRAWSVGEWASRAGQGAFFDWVVGNALLPAVSGNTGVQKIDRTTVPELREIPSAFNDIQAQLDNADTGLNPLGVAHNAIPFDIDPRQITDSAGQTHFEQVYNRAVLAMNNAVTVFNNANNCTQLLRRQADSLADFQKNVLDREVDFTNRLIEIFGYPYPEDIGPGGSYPSGYSGPDLVYPHYNYIDIDTIAGVPAPYSTVVTQSFISYDVALTGALIAATNTVSINIPTAGLSFIKPSGWTQRKAPGEIQRTLGDLLQARTRLLRGLHDYDSLANQVDDQVRLLSMQLGVNAREIILLNKANGIQKSLDEKIRAVRFTQFAMRTLAQIAVLIGDSSAEMLPTDVGLANDVTAPARGALKMVASLMAQGLNETADGLSLTELDFQQAKEEERDANNLELTTLRQGPGITNQIMQLRQLVRQEPGLRLDLYNQRQAIIQAAGAYQAALAKGQRLLDDRLRFRQETAAAIQSYRYKDMAFRIFRNDALQKYRAQFDLAARYVYLCAKAYDYETCLQPWDPRGPGQDFLTTIVRARDLGLMQNGQPVPGSGTGLADALAIMWQNWSLVLRSELGFNNPETETGRFSLRSEFFRTQSKTNGSPQTIWRQTLTACVSNNLFDIPEFRRYCIPFNGTNINPGGEKGIVIPFSTTINFGQNFFGWPLSGGDSCYDSTHFATKIRGVGVWFANYNSLSMSLTPTVYLIPVGQDVLRSPSGNYGLTREFSVVDQLLPVPYVNPNALQDPNWIPINDTLDGNLADIRQFPSFRAYHDGGFTTAEMIYSTRLIGRSVWNTKWLLIIPAGTLYYDEDEAIQRFINGTLVNGQRDGNGVSDIKLFFQTYSYSGN